MDDFHSDWCSMMYSRLMVARSLLTDDGVIYISIDDNEINNAIKITSEVFGEENQLACFCWRTDGNLIIKPELKVAMNISLCYLLRMKIWWNYSMQ